MTLFFRLSVRFSRSWGKKGPCWDFRAWISFGLAGSSASNICPGFGPIIPLYDRFGPVHLLLGLTLRSGQGLFYFPIGSPFVKTTVLRKSLGIIPILGPRGFPIFPGLGKGRHSWFRLCFCAKNFWGPIRGGF